MADFPLPFQSHDPTGENATVFAEGSSLSVCIHLDVYHVACHLIEGSSKILNVSLLISSKWVCWSLRKPFNKNKATQMNMDWKKI